MQSVLSHNRLDESIYFVTVTSTEVPRCLRPPLSFASAQEHKKVLFDSILDYETLTNKNVLACARLTIMSLRHAFENFTLAEVAEIVSYIRNRLELLAKVVQQRAAEMLNSPNPNPK